ncbi:group IIE secretory phospholipase A2-like [Cygnus atratus]|uniref:group IIE secretory phospholipase A2-like n=1 Tax=Cygnus atratus TaxID=8868 RepID=UPI0015D60456|nr:group IIE secretory phospholipase A2-like [Cygnus atratus]
MKLLVLLVCLAGLAPVDGGVVQFARMIKLKTGKNPLAYNGYGCYCGLGGTKQPLDATDWCCHAHDCCYSRLKSSSPGCHPTLVHYTFYLQGGRIVCEPGNFCQKTACECDKAAAECFKRNLGTYNKSYDNYPNLRCKGSRPRC